MKDKFRLIGFVLNSYVFWIIAYIVCLIAFSLTGNKAILSGACGITLFWIIASGSAFDNADDIEKSRIYQFNQWIAIVSILFILQHFLHVLTNITD